MRRESLVVRLRRLLTLLALAGVGSGALTAEEWPQFRGVMAGVGVDHPDLPDTWSPSTNVAWKKNSSARRALCVVEKPASCVRSVCL